MWHRKMPHTSYWANRSRADVDAQPLTFTLGKTMPELRIPSPILYIFSGLPGSGKSSLSKLVARELHAIYLRIDTIEQGLVISVLLM